MSTATEPGSGTTTRPRRAKPAQIVGEVLVTFGVLAGLFVLWQVVINNEVSGTLQKSASDALSREWQQDAIEAPTATIPLEPVVMKQPAADKTFANLIVPRFGDDFSRPIAEGVGLSVLNNVNKGMGHYPSTQMPGEIGNFAIASHRSAYGGAFHLIHHLRVGDGIYVETKDGWYKYIYRNSEYVPVTGVGVIASVPQDPEAVPTQRLITLTTCNPFYSSAERIAAYGVFDSFYPRSDGPPSEIADVAEAAS